MSLTRANCYSIIVSGDSTLREWVINGDNVEELRQLWKPKQQEFLSQFDTIKLYKEIL